MFRKPLAALFLALAILSAPSLAAAGATYTPVTFPDLLSKVAENRGKVVILNFWASWCIPCRQEIPHLKELRSEYSQETLAIYGISVDTNRSSLENWLDDEDNVPNYPIFLSRGDAARGFGVDALPTTVIYDRNGELVVTNLGYMSLDALKSKIDPLISHSPHNE